MKVEIDPDDVTKKSTDDRGRFYLGSDYAGQTVEIAILGVQDEEDEA